MFSHERVKHFWLFSGLVVIAWSACTYERPNVDENPQEPSGAGGATSASNSSSGNGNGPASSSSGNGGAGTSSSSSSGQASSSSSSGDASSSSSSGDPGSSSSSSSSSSSGMMTNENGFIHCGNAECQVNPNVGGCCRFSGGGTMLCTSLSACNGALFYCDGKEDCPQQQPCCFDGAIASCNVACAGGYICNDDSDCSFTGTSCIKDFYGSIGQCQQ